MELIKDKQVGKFFQFSTSNFYQLAYYYNEIREINNKSQKREADFENLNKRLQELNPIRVLVFTRTLRRSQEFKKQRFYISNEKIIYGSHIGGDDVSINFRFDCVLVKEVEVKDMTLYKDLLINMTDFCNKNKIWMVNHIPSMNNFVEKDLMGDYLTEFTKCSEVKKICDKYKLKLLYPQSFRITLS